MLINEKTILIHLLPPAMEEGINFDQYGQSWHKSLVLGQKSAVVEQFTANNQ